jgi:signal transduction histidine kinase
LTPRPPLLHRVTSRQLQIVDLVVAGLAALVTVAHAAANPFPEAPFLAVILAGSGALRRRVPAVALVMATASVAVAIATGFGQGWGPESFIAIPMYQVASVRDRRHSLPALAVTCVVFLVASAVGDAAANGNGFPALALVSVVTAWFVGDSTRVRRLYVAGLADQAAQRQREAEERAQRSVAEERLEIARELHDVVAHSLSVIAVQSGVGRHVIDDQPGEAKKALAAVEATSRSALTELRRMLGVLRRDEGQPATLVPSPGVAALGALVGQVRAAGFEVTLDSGCVLARTLSPSVQLSIYRIVQEALTNVVKHAGPATVRVDIRDETDALVLEINDDGRGVSGAAASGFGDTSSTGANVDMSHHGIIGMRERVELFDGTFWAGPSPEGGFRVVASFPAECLTSP